MNSKDFLKAIELLQEDKGIEKEFVISALKEALEKAYRKHFGTESNVEAIIDEKSGTIRLFVVFKVVEEVEDDELEISLEDARKINPNYQIGEVVKEEKSTEEFGRLAAVHAKQVVKQKVREAEKALVYDEYIDKQHDLVSGIVDRVEKSFAIINLGKTGALLPVKLQMPNETLFEGQRIKVYIQEVDKGSKGAQVIVSRIDAGLVKRLFELESPEIYEGIVEIKSISREAGERTKIAVHSTDSSIDPLGACVGQKGSRVQAIVRELNGEKIDIVEWSEDPKVYISNALSPARIVFVSTNEEDNTALAVVADDQLSLAIGKRGQNARLAVRLTGWKIDIKSESQAIEMGLITESMLEVKLPDVDHDTYDDLFEKRSVEVGVIATAQGQIEDPTFEDQDEVKEVKPAFEPLPIYTEEELAVLESEEIEEDDDVVEEIDYDEYDEYYE